MPDIDIYDRGRWDYLNLSFHEDVASLSYHYPEGDYAEHINMEKEDAIKVAREILKHYGEEYGNN